MRVPRFMVPAGLRRLPVVTSPPHAHPEHISLAKTNTSFKSKQFSCACSDTIAGCVFRVCLCCGLNTHLCVLSDLVIHGDFSTTGYFPLPDCVQH